MEYQHSENPKNWFDPSEAAGPAVLGVAAGLLVSDLLHGNARRALGLTLAVVGVAAVAPKVTGTLKYKIAGPQTRRGSEKTLDNIRDAGVNPENFGFVDEEGLTDTQLGVG